MKYIRFTLFIFCTLTLFSCNRKEQKQNTIFVSIEPQRFFLEKIIDNQFVVQSIIPNGSNPEVYDPTPVQMVAISKSKLYFKVGLLGFENAWTASLQKNNPKLNIVNCSKSIQTINAEDDGHAHGHEHGHEGPDPHIWSSPKTALIMAREMRDEIINIDPANKTLYETNFSQLTQLFYDTDSIIRMYLAKAPSRSFLIYHPSLAYFANEYELCQYSIEHEGKQPTPLELKRTIELAKAEKIKVVFIQTEFDQKNAETIAKEIGAKVVPINLMAYNWDTEIIKIAKALATQNE